MLSASRRFPLAIGAEVGASPPNRDALDGGGAHRAGLETAVSHLEDNLCRPYLAVGAPPSSTRDAGPVATDSFL